MAIKRASDSLIVGAQPLRLSPWITNWIVLTDKLTCQERKLARFRRIPEQLSTIDRLAR
jgi:hypothetical protein